MLINFKIAFRHLWHNKLFSIINIIGLSLGLACCFIILLHIKFESGFDRFHVKKDRIVRVLNGRFSWTPLVMATVLPDYFTEIDKTVRLGKLDWAKFFIIKNNELIEEKNLVYADSTFFSVFSFPILKGSSKKILRAPDRMMISEKIARKYFNNEDPMGKILTMRIMSTTYHFTVEGVFADFPEQSHFHANFLTSVDFCRKIFGDRQFTNWGANSVHTYLLMKNAGSMGAIQERMTGFIDKYVEKNSYTKDLQYYLQPLTRIHLYSKETDADIEPQGSISRIIIFASIAVLILIIAIVNFVMLSLALSNQRIKEFGIRKIVGARQRELVSLVTAEFLIVFILAVQLALMFEELTIPLLKSSLNIELYRGIISNIWTLLQFLAVVFMLGYLASLYITVHVSLIRPVDAIKNALPGFNRWITSRGTLVIFQFSIMTGLLVCLMIMQKQLWLIKHKDLGFRKETLLALNIPFNSEARYAIYKEELIKMPGVLKVSGAAYVPPTDQLWTTELKNPETGESITCEEINADYDIVEALGLEISQGRSFERDFGNDSMAILINETALNQFGFKNPLESYLSRNVSDTSQIKMSIIGVFRDFHMRSLYKKVGPMVIFLSPRMVMQMAIRLAPGYDRHVLAQIENKWKVLFPEDPYQYFFVDEALDLSYRHDDQAYVLISLFAFLSFMIALMGLFGLSAFTMERRTKETGIRKVNGAMSTDIFYVLSRQFVSWILIAFVISVPASWFAMHKWLQHFAYQTGISWWIFMLALLVSLFVALITICWQTYRAATRNPVVALRYE